MTATHGYLPENGSLLIHEADRQAESQKDLMRFIDLNLDNNASHESQFRANDIHDPLLSMLGESGVSGLIYEYCITQHTCFQPHATPPKI